MIIFVSKYKVALASKRDDSNPNIFTSLMAMLKQCRAPFVDGLVKQSGCSPRGYLFPFPGLDAHPKTLCRELCNLSFS